MLTNAKITAVLPVVDINRAKDFYQNKLGLKVVLEEISDENFPSMMFEAGQGTNLLIYQRAQTKAEHTAASFKVDNIEKEVEDLRSKGVTFEEYDIPGIKTENGIASWGEMKSAWFKDTEGNILALEQSSNKI